LTWKRLVPEPTKEFQKNLLFAVRMRYAIIFVGAIIVLGAQRFGLFPAKSAIYTLLYAVIAENIWLHVRFRRWLHPISILWIELFLDNLLITSAVYFTGGHLSPVVTLYLGDAIGFGLFISFQFAALGFLLSLVFFGSMLLVQFMGVLPVIPLYQGEPQEFAYLLIWIISLAIALMMAAYAGWRIATDLKKAQAEARERVYGRS